MPTGLCTPIEIVVCTHLLAVHVVVVKLPLHLSLAQALSLILLFRVILHHHLPCGIILYIFYCHGFYGDHDASIIFFLVIRFGEG